VVALQIMRHHGYVPSRGSLKLSGTLHGHVLKLSILEWFSVLYIYSSVVSEV
jgi:hypothetical protein